MSDVNAFHIAQQCFVTMMENPRMLVPASLIPDLLPCAPKRHLTETVVQEEEGEGVVAVADKPEVSKEQPVADETPAKDDEPVETCNDIVIRLERSSTLKQLKEMCIKYDLSTLGKKGELAQRVAEYERSK